MRVFIDNAFQAELQARKKYIEATSHLFFIIKTVSEDFYVLESFPKDSYKDICIVIGHYHHVKNLLQKNLVSEGHTFLITCHLNQIAMFKRPKKHIYIFMEQNNGYMFPRNGFLYGFEFPITDAELRLFNHPECRRGNIKTALLDVFNEI